MDILIGRFSGYCSGVKLAITRAGQLLKDGDSVYSLGEIVHNPQTVEGLKKRGMRFVADPKEIPAGSPFLVRSHGLPVNVLRQLKRKKLDICDGTCVKIKKIQVIIRELTRNKTPILIIGKPSHPEVMAITSLAGGRHWVMDSVAELEKLPALKELAVVVQTTFNPAVFSDFARSLVLKAKKLVVHNTLCDETRWRQEEAALLAREADLVLIIGGRNSSNTRTLYELVRDKVKAHAIENESELVRAWFRGVGKVALISGASTPIEEVLKVRDKVRAIGQTGEKLQG
jgi:4-hydroxy-3-methylbut-2-enyl diphosphate reductase